MAWLVGLANDKEIQLLEERGWEVLKAPREVRRHICLIDGDEKKASEKVQCVYTGEDRVEKAVMVYVDANLFELMSGPGWDRKPDNCTCSMQAAEYRAS